MAAVAALGVAAPLLTIAGPPVRRVGVYAAGAMVTAALASRRPGRKAVAARWAASTSIRCCSSAPPRPARRYGSPARSRSSSRTGGYECTIVDKGTRQPRACGRG